MEHLRLQHPSALPNVARGGCDRTREMAALLTSFLPGSDPRCVIDGLRPVVLGIREAWTVPNSSVGRDKNEFDTYFRVERIDEADGRVVLGEALLVAYHQFLTDLGLGTSLLPLELGHLTASVERMLCVLADDGPAAPASRTPPEAAPPAQAAVVDAMTRWVTGHHLFFALVQSLIVVHEWLERALRENGLHDAREALVVATELWWACAAAFRFAGDFPAQAYTDTVRPSMAPPFVSEGFSGSLFSDHVYLLRRLKRMKPALQALPRELRAQHRQYLNALDSVYCSHAFVCERFVGSAASLRDSARGTEASAAATIRGRLKQRAVCLARGVSESAPG